MAPDLGPEAGAVEGAFTIGLSQLKVTTPASFWPVVELTAGLGAPTGPLLANFSREELTAFEHPTPDHDPYLPAPTAVHEPPEADPDR